jgi:hypothetical protein
MAVVTVSMIGFAHLAHFGAIFAAKQALQYGTPPRSRNCPWPGNIGLRHKRQQKHCGWKFFPSAFVYVPVNERPHAAQGGPPEAAALSLAGSAVEPAPLEAAEEPSDVALASVSLLFLDSSPSEPPPVAALPVDLDGAAVALPEPETLFLFFLPFLFALLLAAFRGNPDAATAADIAPPPVEPFFACEADLLALAGNASEDVPAPVRFEDCSRARSVASSPMLPRACRAAA